MLRLRLLAQGRENRAVQPRFSVDISRGHLLAHQRPRAAGVDRDLLPPDPLQHTAGIAPGVLQRLVARDHGDTQQLQPGVVRRQHDRHRVVMSGIAVQNDFLSVHACLPHCFSLL